MGGFGMSEILLILGVIILLFGAKKIPELMRGMGRGMKEFQDARNAPATDDKETVVTKETVTTRTDTTPDRL
jgi:sec-independent protein translocase protein TatA